MQKFLERTGPFAHPDFEPSTEVNCFFFVSLTLSELQVLGFSFACNLQMQDTGMTFTSGG